LRFIDPSEAQRLIQSLGIGHAPLAGRDLGEFDPELLGASMVLGEPTSQGRGIREANRHPTVC
jgi:hypothetical protein